MSTPTNSKDSLIMNPNQANYPITLTAVALQNDKSRTLATVVTDGAAKVGDEISHVLKGMKDTLIIQEVVESRPAKGDYSGEQFKGTVPTWNKVICTAGYVTPPAPEDALKKK